EWASPASDEPEARHAAAIYDGIYNRWFLGGVFKGAYPQIVLDGLEPHLPQNWQDDFPTITQKLDWCGLNYYTRKRIAPAPGPWPALCEVEGPLPKTAMGWEIYPQGLQDFLIRTAADYTGDLPLYVTENGMAAPDLMRGGDVDDPDRLSYLAAHLEALRAAQARGVPVKGYFVWSLLDNYEWSFGYEKRFGLVHVDFDTLARTPKASYHAMALALRKDQNR
ncbi:MAG TPA: beta-glucosidase, partial [Citreicella sp.]|nr:beta-glucosidase [Citreicella sp.]